MKKVLKNYVKDVAAFSAGSIMIGAGSKATVAAGGSAAGLGVLASGMGAVAPLVTMKASVGMLGSTMKKLKPKRR